MVVLSIRLPEKILHEVDIHAYELKIARAEYIRKSIEHMNKEMQQHEKRLRLKNLSKLIRKESQIVNEEFERVAYVSKD